MKPNNVLVNAVLAAVVAAATADQKLFSEPGKADKDKALRIANELGLDIDQLQKDTEDPDIKKALDETKDLAQKLDLKGTPMFLIGDRVIAGATRGPLRPAQGQGR